MRAALLAAVVLACPGSAGGGLRGVLPGPPIDVVAAGGPARLPLDAYELDDGDLDLVDQAQEILVADCMRERGFDYEPLPDAAGGGSSASAELQQRPETFASYGLTSERDARRYGYRGPAIAWLAGLDTTGPSLTERFGAGYVAALVSPSGCADRASAELRGATAGELAEPDHVANTTGRLSAEAVRRTEGDDRVVDAVRQWSRCMAAAGHDYATPLDPVREFSEGLVLEPGVTVPPPVEGEIATGVDDVHCKRAVDLEAVWRSVESAYQRVLIEESRAELTEYSRWLDALVGRARRIVGGA
jgi:hypothetical protein